MVELWISSTYLFQVGTSLVAQNGKKCPCWILCYPLFFCGSISFLVSCSFLKWHIKEEAWSMCLGEKSRSLKCCLKFLGSGTTNTLQCWIDRRCEDGLGTFKRPCQYFLLSTRVQFVFFGNASLRGPESCVVSVLIHIFRLVEWFNFAETSLCYTEHNWTSSCFEFWLLTRVYTLSFGRRNDGWYDQTC